MSEDVRAASRREQLWGTTAPDKQSTLLEGVQRTQLKADFGEEPVVAGFFMYTNAVGAHAFNAQDELPHQSVVMRALSRLRRSRRSKVGHPTARSNIEVSTCLGLMRKLVQSERTRIARQYLHEVIDDLLHRGQFATVDALLFSADPFQDDPRILITLLTATKPGRERLRLRAEFYRRTVEAIKKRNLEVPGLLAGLE
jgi:hypothetical protein